MAERFGISGSLHNYKEKEPTFSRGRMSDKRIEMYWKELCSQENSSKTRNKALLDDFDRIEQQSAALEAQTEKLKQLKDRYECYINSMYPRWLDELKRHKQRLQLDRDKTNLQESQPHEELRSNNVRFGSPLYTEQNQETFMASSLYDSQDTTQHAHDTYNQTSIPHGTGRVKTLDWDSYHRESSLDFYNFGQISSMRTPHGHFAPRNDYMRFSTPYNPAHNGPFDSRNGLNQSFDMMYGNTRNYHPRHPFMGSPIRHNGPASPGNGHGRSYYNEETHLRPDNSDISYQQPYTSADYYSQSRHQQHRPQQNHPHDRSRDRRPLQGDPPQDWRPYDNQSRDGRPQQGDPPQDWRPHDSQSRDGRPQLGDPPQDWRPYDSQSRDGRPQLGDPPQDWRSYDSQSRDGRPQQGDHSQDWYPLDRQSRDGYPQQKGPPHDCHPQDRQSRGGRQQQAEYGYTDDRHFQDQHEDTYKEPHKLNVSDPQKTEVRSPASAQHSPNEPPEKPLELAIDLNSKHEKPVENKIQDKEIPKEKASIHSSNTEKPEKLEQEEISASTESGLLLSDLQPRVSQQTAKQEMNLQDIDQKSTNSEKRDQPKNKKEDNKKSPKGSGRIKPDSDDLLDILSDGTLSSGDVSDSDLSHNYDNAYEPSLEIAMDGLTKNSNVIQIKQDSALLNKPNPDIIINEQSSKHINTQITENPSSNKQDGNKKSNIEDVGGDVLTPSPSNEEVSPSVSVKGSLSLLQVVDADVEASSSPETFYRAPRCSQEMKEDIIERAESGSSLENYDPSILSMVLLDELPKITRASPSGGLVTSDNMGLAITEPQQLRNVIEPTLTPLWDGLVPHMVRLVEYNVMAVDEVSGLFAAALMALNSAYTNKFQALLAGLIRDSISTRAIQSPEEVINTGKDSEQKVLNDNHSVTSEESSTLGSTPPISGKQEMLPNEDPPASLHSLERTLSYEDDFEEEVDIPLTETAAYKKMMSGGDQQGKSKSREEDSEGDDDLERTLARSISPPIVSPRQRSPSPAKPTASDNSKTRRQKPKLNIFGGNDNLGLSYGTEDLGDSWGGSSGRLSSTGKSDVTDKTVSPPSSPDLEGGYIPTAMEDSQKKTDTAPPKPTTTRKPGFWNNSDTESEVDLQLSTGALDDDDDFDFYG